MKLYAVSYYTLMDNDLTTDFIMAEDELDAAKKKLGLLGDEYIPSDEENIDSMEELKQYCFNGDCMIHAVEVPK